MHSKLEWVWKTQHGIQETLPISVLKEDLELLFRSARASVQTVYHTHSLGSRGGKRVWFVCPTCPRRVLGVLASCTISTAYRFAVEFAGDWPIHPSLSPGIEAMDVGTEVCHSARTRQAEYEQPDMMAMTSNILVLSEPVD